MCPGACVQVVATDGEAWNRKCETLLKEKKWNAVDVADVFLACSHCAADIRARRSAARASPSHPHPPITVI